MQTKVRFKNFQEFWPFYLGEHSNPLNRRLHFFGSFLVLSVLIAVVATGNWNLLWAAPVFGYGFAWFGHFVVEENRPATFTYPMWSLRGDFQMFFLTLLGRLDAEIEKMQSKKNKPHIQ